MKLGMSDINKTFLALSGTDLARLAIPKIPDYRKILFDGNSIAHIEFMNSQLSQISKAHQIAFGGMASRMVELAKTIENQYKPAISAFQSITERLQPLILQQSKIAENFKNIALISNPTLEAIKTLSSFNAFSRYCDAYEQFGGYINPDSVTKEEIEETINQNKDLISEVNTVVINAEIEGVSPSDVPGLIFSFLHDKIPYLSQRTFSCIVLIFSTVILTYGLYSNYTTNSAIDNEIVPTLNENSKTLEIINNDTEEIKKSMNDLSGKVENIDSNLDEMKDLYNEFKGEVEDYMEETNVKLELLYQEMLRQESKKE